jgi:hypothetical protein
MASSAARRCKKVVGNAIRRRTSFRNRNELHIGRRNAVALENPFGTKTELHPKLNRCNSNIVKARNFSTSADDVMQSERESMPFDVLIVGGGPSGLAASIRLKQLCEENDVDLSVCVVEKGR